MKQLRMAATILSVILASIALIIAVIYISTDGDYHIPETVEHDRSIPSIEINGTTLHAETFGESHNRPLIVIHGGPGHDYRSLLALKKLSDQYFVIFYDQRGTGLSARVDPSELTIESSVADLSAIVEHYAGDRKVNLFGHSWGGVIATLYLAENPERVDRLVLAEPPFLTPDSAKAFRKIMKPEFSHKLLYGGLKLFFESLHVNGPDDRARDDFFFSRYSHIEIDNNPLAYYDCGNNKKPKDVAKWRYGLDLGKGIVNDLREKHDKIGSTVGLKYFKGTVLFLTSECNSATGRKHQAEHMKLFRNANEVIVKNAGHNMVYEKPDESIDAIREYLNASK